MNRAMERSEIGANFGGEWGGWRKTRTPHEPVGQEAHRKLGLLRKKFFLWRKERNLEGEFLRGRRGIFKELKRAPYSGALGQMRGREAQKPKKGKILRAKNGQGHWGKDLLHRERVIF